MKPEIEQMMREYQSAIERYLDGCFRLDRPQKKLFDAMRYSLLAGGKRIRPILVLEFCRLCGGDPQKALPFAAAIEMVHTYSLIHDDLPCMDNDDYRRGRLTNHKVYGEAQAVLAGDALLTAAFRTVSMADAAPETIVSAVQILSGCAGELGMVGGQTLDIEGENKKLTADQVYTIHHLKTGALISAACRMGVVAGGGTAEQLSASKAYAESVGLAFQIRDDMLDVLGDAEKLGKKTHMDENKNTFVTLFGLDRCRQIIAEENQKALEALKVFGSCAFLEGLTEQMASRDF